MIECTPKKAQESARDYAARILVENIVRTRLEPGQQLVEQELCQMMKISRTPLREAMLELANRQLLEIRPKIGSYVAKIDPEIVEQVRHLRSVLESELAALACRKCTQEEMDRLWENTAVWRMYIERKQEEKIFSLDKEFHRMIYALCGRMYWYGLVESAAPHFDRTTVLSLRCRPMEHILEDHEALLLAVEARDETAARAVAVRHMERYRENIDTIRQVYPDYFQQEEDEISAGGRK